MAGAVPDSGSFRDRGGRVYRDGERILRAVMPPAVADFEFVRRTGLVDELIADGRLVGESRVDGARTLGIDGDACFVLEHPRIPFLSWPYEWSFSALKKAALFHLDLQLQALEKGVTLADATAFNVQFDGTTPIFIDHLSFRRYEEGEFWSAHRQFCEQFVNPLVLQSALGLPFNPWYRGSPEGIPATDLNRILPLRRKLSWQVFTHVTLQARLQAGSDEQAARRRLVNRKLPEAGFREILSGLRRWLARLEPASGRKTVWQDYATDHSYDPAEQGDKKRFVSEFADRLRPELLLDLGCNSGDYSAAALAAGAASAIGFDFDVNAVDTAFREAERSGRRFLPLVIDAANPSPSIGWRESERPGIGSRAKGDAVLALALIHHLVIGKNLRLDDVIDWIVSMAPAGVIEFVPKADPMVGRLLSLRDDIFDEYSAESFEASLLARADIVDRRVVSRHGRTLYWFGRRD